VDEVTLRPRHCRCQGVCLEGRRLDANSAATPTSPSWAWTSKL